MPIATDFNEQLSGLSDPADIWAATCRFYESFGFDGLIYLDVDGVHTDMRTTLPDWWLSHYHEENYQEIDPFVGMCCATYGSIKTGAAYVERYDELSTEQRKLVLEAGETGFVAGFSSTFRLANPGGAGGWNILSSAGAREVGGIFEEHGESLLLASFFARQALAANVSYLDRDILSKREAECLQWLASGLRTQQIADKMSLQPVTIEFHIRNARRKLGAATREQALAIAISNSLVCL